MLAIQGPVAERLLTQIQVSGHDQLQNYRCARCNWRGDTGEHTLWLSRTGYTGEDGFECFGPAASVIALFQALLSVGAIPCGLGCRDTLRLEAGMPLYGHELDRQHSPIAAGLGFAVRDGDGFPGAGRLATEKSHGCAEQLVGLIGDGRRPPRQG